MGARVVRMAFTPGFGIRPGFVTAMVGGETCKEVETEGLGVGIECPLTPAFWQSYAVSNPWMVVPLWLASTALYV